MSNKLKAFYWNNVLYVRLVPGKSLFRSSMVHEVVNRGDVFAMRVSDQLLTIVPGKAQVTQVDLDVPTDAQLQLTLLTKQTDMFAGETIL